VDDELTRIAFIDTETTGLDPAVHEIFDLAIKIFRVERSDELTGPYLLYHLEDEIHWWIEPLNLGRANQRALELNHYWARSRQIQLGLSPGEKYGPTWVQLHARRSMVQSLVRSLQGCFLAGCNPGFDAAMLEAFVRGADAAPTWHHRKVDVESIAMSELKLPHPPGLNELLQRMHGGGAEPQSHTAMGDLNHTIAAFFWLMGNKAAVVEQD
jgi:oligoribonuclease (3'-5' exoribonuclease)